GIDEFVLLITENFSKFWIEIIADELNEEIIFQPDKPSPKADKFIQDLLNRRPLFDPKGLTASQLQAKHELTAFKLADAIEIKDEKKIRRLFQKAGLSSITEMDFICSRNDAPLKNAIIEINFSLDNTNEWINNNLAKIKGKYYTKTNEDLHWIILIEKKGLAYISENGDLYSFIEYPEKKKNLIKLLTSIIACIDIRAAFNGETFEAQFGPYSPFFMKANYLMVNHLEQHKTDLIVIREEWERYFGKVYQEGDIDEELFIKHSYLSLLIKNVLFCKYLPEKVVESAESFVELSEYFESRGVELFLNDFYTWANNIQELREDIFQALNGAIYESDDIFRIIYQDMVSPITRHALGEFYTHPELAQLMVDEVYTYGKFTLDPACGSGTFLVEILRKIKEIAKTDEDIIKAMKKVYGFDVNPIAVLVSKANLLLHLEELKVNSLPINIFLTDSLNPIERNPQSDMIWGVHYTFSLGSIGNLIINNKFFHKRSDKDPHNYLQEFSKFLLYIDEEMTKKAKLEEIIDGFDKKFQNKWLDEKIQGCPNTYRDNIHYIIKTLTELHSQKKNHIWLYLLYNSIGALLIKNRVDLVIGNPPWVIIKSIFSNDYKNEIKEMGKKFDIFLGGKTTTSTEITTLFIRQSVEIFLNESGSILFVTPASLMTAGQHERFRCFDGLKNVKFWEFDKDIFKIHNVCFYAEKGEQKFEERINPEIYHFHIKKDPLIFEYIGKDIYYPEYIKEIKKKVRNKKKEATVFLIGRLNPPKKIYDLTFPIEDSIYKSKFYQGASLVPRNLLFIKIIEKIQDYAIVKPDDSIQAQKNSTWNFMPYKTAQVFFNDIHKIVKSTELIPFYLLDTHLIFLPLDIVKNEEKKEYYDFQNLDKMDEKSRKHYLFLEELYEKNKKAGATIQSLKERVTYQGHLTTPIQRSSLRIVYNANGTIPKGALIRDSNIIVDTKLYHYACDSEEEAYYLLGIINSKALKENIGRVCSTGAHGSTRNLHLHIWDFPFPLFTNLRIQNEIVEHSKKCEKYVKNFVDRWKVDKFKKEKGKVCCNYCKNVLTLKNIKKHLSNCKKRRATSNKLLQEWKVIETKKDILLKPATIQNKLFNDKDFNKLLEELDVMIKNLMKI
ncbi:MAG: N-6 DNA methylase, partial [Candidatus Helarchaeota archaeon]